MMHTFFKKKNPFMVTFNVVESPANTSITAAINSHSATVS